MDESTLRSISLFESLSPQARASIAQHADELDLPEGTELARQGEFAYEFFVIEEGGAEVLRDGERIAELGPGTSSARWASWVRSCATRRSPRPRPRASSS